MKYRVMNSSKCLGRGLGIFLLILIVFMENFEAAHPLPEKVQPKYGLHSFMYGCHDIGMRYKQLAFLLQALTRCVDKIRSYTESNVD
jgi:hypothetical protein